MADDKNKELIADCIAEYKSTKDSSQYASEVDICISNELEKKPKFTPKLTVFSKYRVIVVSGKGKYQSYHYLNLVMIAGEGNEIILRFTIPGKGNNYLVINSNNNNKDQIIKAVLENYKLITFGNLDMLVNKRTDSIVLSNLDPGPCNGIIHAYYAWSNYHNTPIKVDIVNYFEDCEKNKITDLDLRLFPGIDGKSELSFDIVTIGYALRFNTWFRGFSLAEGEHKDAALMLERWIKKNTTLTKISLVHSQTEITSNIGLFLRQNREHQVQILQFSGNKIPQDSGIELARAFKVFPHTLRVLDLTDCQLSHQCLTTIFNAFRSNFGMSLGLEEFSLAGNEFDKTCSGAFISWLQNIKKSGNLQRLNLARTNVNGTFLSELSSLPVKFLDISDNKFDKQTFEYLAQFCTQTRTIQVFRLAGTQLPTDVLNTTLKSLFSNEDLIDINLDLSRNKLGTQGAKMISEVFSSGENLAGLNISDNFIREQGAVAILGSLSKNVKRIVLDYNFPAGSSNSLGTELARLIKDHPALFSLSVRGQMSNRVNYEAMEPFIAALKNNTTLGELDLSDNLLGDIAISEIANSMRSNKGLLELRLDYNNVTLAGYQSIRRMLDVNTTLANIPFPAMDFNKDVTTNAKVPNYESKFREILFQIRDITSDRRKKNGISQNLDLLNVFEFDKKWSTPSGVPPPLKRTPAELREVQVKDSNLEGIDEDLTQTNISRRTLVSTAPSSTGNDKVARSITEKSPSDLSGSKGANKEVKKDDKNEKKEEKKEEKKDAKKEEKKEEKKDAKKEEKDDGKNKKKGGKEDDIAEEQEDEPEKSPTSKTSGSSSSSTKKSTPAKTPVRKETKKTN